MNTLPDAVAGMRVLVLEDEALVSMLLEDMLQESGHEVVGPFLRLERAQAFVEAGEEAFDLAILDVNVAGQRSFPLAETLKQRGVPFLFVTGYDAQGIEERWRSWPRLRKPFTRNELDASLRRVAEFGGGTAYSAASA